MGRFLFRNGDAFGAAIKVIIISSVTPAAANVSVVAAGDAIAAIDEGSNVDDKFNFNK